MNILNITDVECELRRVASHAIHPATHEWVMTVARNYLLGHASEKDLTSNYQVYVPLKPGLNMPACQHLPAWALEALALGDTLHWFDPIQVRRRPFWQSLEHIVDWFNDWAPTDTRLRRVSRINFNVACTAAGLWINDVTTNLWDYVKDRPPIIKTYENGYYWVKLVTNLHFERESKLQSNCIGNGNYFSMFKQGNMEYYSLRDKHNNPHCTTEIAVNGKERTVKQCKGHSNGKPSPAYQKYIRRFFNDMKWDITGDERNVD